MNEHLAQLLYPGERWIDLEYNPQIIEDLIEEELSWEPVEEVQIEEEIDIEIDEEKYTLELLEQQYGETDE